jgi:hypothetical protein
VAAQPAHLPEDQLPSDLRYYAKGLALLQHQTADFPLESTIQYPESWATQYPFLMLGNYRESQPMIQADYFMYKSDIIKDITKCSI